MGRRKKIDSENIKSYKRMKLLEKRPLAEKSNEEIEAIIKDAEEKVASKRLTGYNLVAQLGRISDAKYEKAYRRLQNISADTAFKLEFYGIAEGFEDFVEDFADEVVDIENAKIAYYPAAVKEAINDIYEMKNKRTYGKTKREEEEEKKEADLRKEEEDLINSVSEDYDTSDIEALFTDYVDPEEIYF